MNEKIENNRKKRNAKSSKSLSISSTLKYNELAMTEPLILEEVLKKSEESLSKASVLNDDTALEIIFELFSSGGRTNEYFLNEFGPNVIKTIAILYANDFIALQNDKIKLSEYGHKVVEKINSQAFLKLKPYNNFL